MNKKWLQKVMPQTGYISPCAAGWGLGILFGADMFLHYMFSALNWEFLWWNHRTFGYVLAMMPEWLQMTSGSSPLLPVIALLFGMVIGGVSGLLFGLLYNWAQKKCSCKWCRV